MSSSAPAGKEHKSRLGRGLSSLLSDPVPVSAPAPPLAAPSASDASVTTRSTEAMGTEDQVMMIALDQLEPSQFQPRRRFDPDALAALAASIKATGVMQPVLARAREQGGYEIIAGERRWRAARDAGLERVPVLVRTLSDQETAEWSLVENLQREDLNALDRSVALRRLAEEFGLSHGSIADRVGLERSSVTNLIRLGDLEGEILELLGAGTLGAGHGKALLSMAAGRRRVDLARRAAKAGWSVRRLERAASAGRSGAQPRSQAPKSPAVIDMERQLRDHLGSDVAIDTKGDGKRGTITIAFYDLEHFSRLVSQLGLQREP